MLVVDETLRSKIRKKESTGAARGPAAKNIILKKFNTRML